MPKKANKQRKKPEQSGVFYCTLIAAFWVK